MNRDMSKARRRILLDIARIGSQLYQSKVCVEGTSQAYVLLDELIDITLSRVEHEIANDLLARKWSQQEKDSLHRFVERVNFFYNHIAWQDENLTIASIVNEDSWMKKIREAANECTEQIHVTFSIEELLAD
jgi:hypothetical protein